LIPIPIQLLFKIIAKKPSRLKCPVADFGEKDPRAGATIKLDFLTRRAAIREGSIRKAHEPREDPVNRAKVS
jgi:hypothetical protein